MSSSNPEFEYYTGQLRPGFPSLLAEYEALGAQAVADEEAALDLRYGPGERETFDFFAARAPARGTLAYFHAGYWQKGDKAGFRFIAPTFTAQGLNVAVVNYPLCPAAPLEQLLDATGRAMPAVAARSAQAAGRPLPLVVAGHSAGGQIVTELGLATPSPGQPPIAGVIALSGVFDLVPLVGTSVNAALGLDEARAAAHSPLRRVRPGAPPALFAVGGAETAAFIDQNRRMHEAWSAAGNRSSCHVEPGADHYTLLRAFTAPGGTLAQRVRDLLDQACGAAPTPQGDKR